MHVAEQGIGPTVLLCHGFPECWYSWRHQLGALAASGFHAVAPDIRGYGQTDAPTEIERYTLLHLVGDMIGLLDVKAVCDIVVDDDSQATERDFLRHNDDVWDGVMRVR